MSEQADHERAVPNGARLALLPARVALTLLLWLAAAIGVTGSAMAGPIASLSAYRLNFAPQAVGTTSDPQTVILTNQGDAPLTISDIALDSADFAITAGSGPGTLLPGTSRTVEIRYTPHNSLRRVGILQVASDAPGSPHCIGLFGAEDTQPGPRVSLGGLFADLGFEPVGTTMSTGTFLENLGNAPLTIRSVTITGEHAGDFSLISGGQPGILTPGTRRTISVRFHQSAYGARNALLVIDDDAPGSPHTFAMFSTNPTGPAPVISPTSLQMGQQPVGSTSTPQIVTLTNTGTTPLHIHSVAVGGGVREQFVVVSGGEPGFVQPGESRTIRVAFAPYANGGSSQYDASHGNPILLIAHSALGADQGPVQIPLTGTSTVPQAVPSTYNLPFTSQRLATSSDTQTVTLTNNGTAPLVIAGLKLTGPNAPEFIISPGAVGHVLAPGDSVPVNARFAPTGIGARSAALQIETNLYDSPLVVNLTGTGVMPVLRLSQDSLGFGPEPVGLTGSRALLLQNTGNAPLQVSSLAFTGSNAAEFALAFGTPASTTLQPGDMTLLNIEFSPTATGPRSATLVITDDAVGSPHTVQFTGTGTEPLFTLSAAALMFHIQPTGTVPPPQTVTFTNGGDAPLAIDGVALTGPDAARFQIISDSGEKSLNPGASRSVQISFNPTTVTIARARRWWGQEARITAARIASVGYSATLEIKHNDPRPGSPRQVMLTALPAGQAPPVGPTGLSARAASAREIDPTWADNSDNEQAFAIWRRDGTGDWHRVGVVVPNVTRFADLGLLPGSAYTYRVRATTGDFASPWSNEVTATTPPLLPAPPSHMVATVRSSAEVELTWTTGGGDETGLSIFRRAGMGEWQRIAVVAPQVTRYFDRGVQAGVSYSYRLRSHTSSRVSAWTNEASVTPRDQQPVAPLNLRAPVVSVGEVDLTWESGGGNETGVAIFRRAGSGEWERIGVVAPTSTRYADRSVTAGTSYAYRVRTHNRTLVSAWTNEVSVSTPPAP
jgi:hypothetical protein